MDEFYRHTDEFTEDIVDTYIKIIEYCEKEDINFRFIEGISALDWNDEATVLKFFDIEIVNMSHMFDNKWNDADWSKC